MNLTKKSKTLIITSLLVVIATVFSVGVYAQAGFLDAVATTLGLHVEGNAGIEDNLYVGDQVGVGTTSPMQALDVAGKIKTSEGIVFPDGTEQDTAYVEKPDVSQKTHTAGEDIAKGNAVRFGYPDQLDQFQQDTNNYVYVYANKFHAQTFTTGSNVNNITSIKLNVQAADFPIGNIEISIRELIGGEPGNVIVGNEVASLPINSLTSISTYPWISFNFDNPISVAPNTKYAIHIACPDATTYTEAVKVYYAHDSRVEPYALGKYMSFYAAGNRWDTSYNRIDFAFETYHGNGEDLEKIYKSNTDIPEHASVIGLASEAATKDSSFLVDVFGKSTALNNLEVGAHYEIGSNGSLIKKDVDLGNARVSDLVAYSENELLIHKNIGRKVKSGQFFKNFRDPSSQQFVETGFTPGRIEFDVMFTGGLYQSSGIYNGLDDQLVVVVDKKSNSGLYADLDEGKVIRNYDHYNGYSSNGSYAAVSDVSSSGFTLDWTHTRDGLNSFGGATSSYVMWTAYE